MKESPYGEGPCAPCDYCAGRDLYRTPCSACQGYNCGHGRVCPARWEAMTRAR